MTYFALIFCMITTVTIGVDIPIPCTRRRGARSNGIHPNTSTVECNTGETMVSCGINGFDAIGGTEIDTTSNICTAYDHSSSRNLRALAHCCVFPTQAAITTFTTTSTTGTVACPLGYTLTGCSYTMIAGDANEIRGAYSGAQSSPPQTAGWITTSDTCNAETNSSTTTVEAVARCVAFGDTQYELLCETKANFTDSANFGGCQTGDMMGCNAFSMTGDLDMFYVNPSDACRVRKNNAAKLYANAICCQLVLTTGTPTSAPSLNPSASPTLYPSASPSRNPSQSPSLNPSASPTLYPTASPSRNPTQSPSRNPTASPSRNPTQSPSRNPTESSSEDVSASAAASEDSGSGSYDSDSGDGVFLSAADANVADVDAFVAKKDYVITMALSDDIVVQLSLMAAIVVISNVVMCYLCKT